MGGEFGSSLFLFIQIRYSSHDTKQHARTHRPTPIHGRRSAGAGAALAVVTAAAAVGGLAGLGRRLELGLPLRGHAEDDGGLGAGGGALLLDVRVHLAALAAGAAVAA